MKARKPIAGIVFFTENVESDDAVAIVLLSYRVLIESSSYSLC
jgi:hypothetical protein